MQVDRAERQPATDPFTKRNMSGVRVPETRAHVDPVPTAVLRTTVQVVTNKTK